MSEKTVYKASVTLLDGSGEVIFKTVLGAGESQEEHDKQVEESLSLVRLISLINDGEELCGAFIISKEDGSELVRLEIFNPLIMKSFVESDAKFRSDVNYDENER